MKDKVIKIVFNIRIVFRRPIFFMAKVKKYQVFKTVTYQSWSDPSFGNGGGSYSPDITKNIEITVTNTLMEAENLVKELKKLDYGMF